MTIVVFGLSAVNVGVFHSTNILFLTLICAAGGVYDFQNFEQV